MVATGSAAVTPSHARRKNRQEFLGKVSGLVAAMRRASQQAEVTILQSADRKWFRENPENEPSPEFPSSNDSHLAELETATATLLQDLNNAIEASQVFN